MKQEELKPEESDVEPKLAADRQENKSQMTKNPKDHAQRKSQASSNE